MFERFIHTFMVVSGFWLHLVSRFWCLVSGCIWFPESGGMAASGVWIHVFWFCKENGTSENALYSYMGFRCFIFVKKKS